MGAIVSVAGLGVMLALNTPPALRAMIGFPVFLTAVCALQVRRNTCVKHAAAGVFEHEDFSTTPVSTDDARASKHTAMSIWRDAAIFAILAVALTVGGALLF